MAVSQTSGYSGSSGDNRNKQPRNERVLALTTGEPAGVGPELSAAAARWFAARQLPDTRLVLIGDAGLLERRGHHMLQLPNAVGEAPVAAGLPSNGVAGASVADGSSSERAKPASTPRANTGAFGGLANVEVHHVPLQAPCTPGELDPANSGYVLRTLEVAATMAMQGHVDAIVTAPVHKGVINDGGHAFSGHTEFFQEHAGCEKVVMMLAGGGLRVALATTHLPLRAVPGAITVQLLRQVLGILNRSLQQQFHIARPRIAVCGLNPHAGEGGHMGREEIDTIEPALRLAQAAGIDAQGPLPADTLFVPDIVAPFDAVLAMYHDQGLPVLKHASFGHGVNITLGLPYIRTSVDHGTALGLAGTGKANPQSLFDAIDTAISMLPKEDRQQLA